jgi:hypothetical protein
VPCMADVCGLLHAAGKTNPSSNKTILLNAGLTPHQAVLMITCLGHYLQDLHRQCCLKAQAYMQENVQNLRHNLYFTLVNCRC